MLALTRNREMRNSGVVSVGQFPKHWRILPGLVVLRERQIKNKGNKESTVLSLSYGRVVVKPEDKLRGLVPESFETYQIAEPGNIIVRPTDLQNDQVSIRVGQVRDRGIITSAYLCLEVKGDLSPDFGHLLLSAYDLKKVFYGLGSGLRQNLSWVDFRRLPIPVPSPEEQAQIVRFVRDLDQRVNRLIKAKRRLIELLNEQKQAIIQQAVIRGLDPNVPLKPSGIEWIGDVPEHWQVIGLKRILRALIDCEHKTAPIVESSQFRVVRTTAVRYGRLNLNGTYFTSEEGFSEWTKRGKPEPGDVIFTREAPAGEACVVPKDVPLCLGQRTVLMKLRESVLPEFLVMQIYGGAACREIQLASQGSTVGHFNMSDISVLPILLPPIEEQELIVADVGKKTKDFDLAIERATSEIDLIREYRTRLIAEVVTGQFDLRNVNFICEDGTNIASESDLQECEFPGDEDIREREEHFVSNY